MAAVALARVDQVQAAARHGSEWVARYLAAYGVASGAFMLVVSLLGRSGWPAGVAAAVVSAGLWLAFVVASALYAYRQRVTLRGYGRIIGMAFGAWGALCGMAWGIGSTMFAGQVAFWVPAAVVSAAPFLVGSTLAARR